MALHERRVPKATLGGSKGTKAFGSDIKTSTVSPKGQDPMALPRKVRVTGSTRG